MELRTKAVRQQGYGELNWNAGKRESPLRRLPSEDILSFASPNYSNGRPQNVDVSCNSKQNGGTLLGRGIVKTKNVMQKSVLDKRNVKNCGNKLDSISIRKSDTAPISNGIVANDYACIPNGYAGEVAERNGSGSESGYNTPKKCKTRLPRVDLGLLQDRVMQPEADTVNFSQGPVDFKPDVLLESDRHQLSYTNSACKYEAGGSTRGKTGAGDEQRKIPEGKPILCKKLEERPKCKQPAIFTSGIGQKDDSWTLFKPPPVFPVDNSSAKIVPRISYASKVKENLNKAVQTPSVSLCSSSFSSSSGDTPLQTPNRLTHVPMSAMKSVTSASFSNGPVLAGTDGAGYTASNQSLLASIASTTMPQSSAASRDLSTAAAEQKSSLFVYPSNMQSLPMGLTQPEFSGQTNQHSLGEIFQNQWGLSFINEPSAGTDSIDVQHSDKVDLTFEDDYAPTLMHRDEKDPTAGELAVFPKAYELDKRTSPPILSNLLKSGVSNLGTVMAHEPCHIGELQKADPMTHDTLVFLSKDCDRASPTNPLLASAKEPQYLGSLEKNHSSGTFNPSAAIVYHTREIESIWNLQKQDPKRIITYNEAMDHIAH